MDNTDIECVNECGESSSQVTENCTKRYQEKDYTTTEDETGNLLRRKKREIEEEDKEWTVVKSKDKKLKTIVKEEIYISSNEKLPKLFAMAKLFKTLNIDNIDRVKFISPFKVRVDLSSEHSAYKLENSQELITKGWKISRAMETNMSFGIIKNIDIDLNEKDIIENITCPNDGKLISAFRLNRLDRAEREWKSSESIRLGFKGSFLPAYVVVDGLRIKVIPYVFPVSQCAKCWKYGHATKKCPSYKITCPKCSGEHANCETTNYKCVNCNGIHMALAKEFCPTYHKEKKLRKIMADFNCTYRKALTIYVSPNSSDIEEQIETTNLLHSQDFTTECNNTHAAIPKQKPTFAETVKKKSHSESKRSLGPTKKSQRRPPSPHVDWSDDLDSYLTPDPGAQQQEGMPTEETPGRSFYFWELLQRIKDILFMRDITIHSKIKSVVRCCIEWLVIVAVDFIPEWPLLQLVLDYIIRSNG